MPSTKEIRNKIHSVQNTRKITKAMEMVAASKMRKAQDRMFQGRPYSDKVRNIIAHFGRSSVDYKHPFLVKHPEASDVGLILVTTDKGLAGALNTNIQRAVGAKLREWTEQGKKVTATAIGNKGCGFLQRIGVPVVTRVVPVGDKADLNKLLGAIQAQLEAFAKGEIGVVYLAYSKFVNAMRQEPVIEQLLPLSSDKLETTEQEKQDHSWDYLYEPGVPEVVDELLRRYIESIVCQAVAENLASEQSARMVAMKAASDNAANLISELQLVYNKTRQAGITTEITEIVSGAAAVS